MAFFNVLNFEKVLITLHWSTSDLDHFDFLAPYKSMT